MSLLRHLTGYLPVKLASAAASFGGVYAFTRLLGPEEYGRYALMVSVLSLVHTISLTWVEAANYRFTGRAAANGRLADHYATALALMRRSILVALAIMALLYAATWHLPGYAQLMPWVALLMVVNTVIQMALEAHRASQRVGRYVLTQTLRLLGGFLLGMLIAWQLGLGAAAPFIGLLAAAAPLAVREGHFLVRAARGGRVLPGSQRAWMGYGLPIAAALMLDILLSAADRFLIAGFLGEAAVGAYAAGYGVADKTVLLICAWAATAGSPLVMAAYETGGPAGARKAARGLISTMLFVAVPAATGLALVAQPLSEAMIGEALRDQAVHIIPWIAFAGLLNGLMIHYASEAFQLAHRTRLRALLMIVPAGLNIGLNLALLPTFGLMGAVYATVISYGVGVGLLAMVGGRLVPLPWPPVTALKIAAASAAMAPAVWLVPDFGSWGQLFAEALAGAVTFLLAALLLDAAGLRSAGLQRFKASEATSRA